MQKGSTLRVQVAMCMQYHALISHVSVSLRPCALCACNESGSPAQPSMVHGAGVRSRRRSEQGVRYDAAR
eukprot:6178868-Prymnesium_polylepis.1